MSLPEGMSHAARENAACVKDGQPPSGYKPRTLYALLIMAVLFGAAGTTASIIAAQSSTEGQRQDAQQAREAAEQNTDLLQQVARLEEQNRAEVEEHRRRNEALHADLCRLVYEVIEAAPSLRDKGIEPCRGEAK